MHSLELTSARLIVTAGTVDLLWADLDGPQHLGRLLEADVASDWPPAFLDRQVRTFVAARLRDRPAERGWWVWYICRKRKGARPLLMGEVGFKGRPSTSGIVDVSYSVVASEQGRGYVSEALDLLLDWAFVHPGVVSVRAQTYPNNHASRRVLEKLGFIQIDAWGRDEMIWFERLRHPKPPPPNGT